MPNGVGGLFSGFAQGFSGGAQLGLMAERIKGEQEQRAADVKAREADRVMRVNLGKLDAAFRLMVQYSS